MSYTAAHAARLKDIKSLGIRLKSVTDSLSTRIASAEKSIAANVTASTDSDADYAAEVVDSRIDAAGSAHASSGANIRYWQETLTEANEYIQKQVNDLSEVYLEVLAQIGQIESRLRVLEN